MDQVRRCCPELFARASVLLLLRFVELAVLFDESCSCILGRVTKHGTLALLVAMTDSTRAMMTLHNLPTKESHHLSVMSRDPIT